MGARLLLRVAERSHLQHFCCVAEMINNAGAAVLLSVTYMIELRMENIPENHHIKATHTSRTHEAPLPSP